MKKLSLLLSADPPHRSQNDDYFPQGDEYENEIGTDDYNHFPESKKSHKPRGRKSTTTSITSDEDHDDFSSVLLAAPKSSSPPIHRNCRESSPNILQTKSISERDTLESLQILVEKVAEFKRRIFGSEVYKSKTEMKIEPIDHKRNGGVGQSGNLKEDHAKKIEKIWLGDPDCGEGPPDRPIKGPCHPPDCPCVPMKKPGYPARPRTAKKDFCVKCPPKKPCNLNKCPPDADGTCGKAALRRGDLLKLISESQATFSLVRSRLSRSTTRFLVASTWNVRHPQPRDLQRRFFSDCSGKPPKKPSPCSKPSPAESECKESEKKPSKDSQDCKKPTTALKSEKKCIDPPKPPKPPSPSIAPKCKETEKEPKVLYRKCPPLPKLPQLPKCPKPPEPKVQKPCRKISAPKCPPPPSLPKCPECPKCPEPPKVSAKKTDDCPPELEEPKGSSSINCTDDDSHGGTVGKKSTEKKKSLWEKISDSKKRKMSTYHRRSETLKKNDVSIAEDHQRRSHVRTSSAFFSSFSCKSGNPSSLPPWKSRKCKTIEEVCGEDVDPKLKALECKPINCPKDPNAACYPDKPRCAEVRKPPAKKQERDKTFGRKKKKVGAYDRQNDDCVPSSVVKAVIEKIDYSKIGCEPPKLTKLGPCPAPPQCFDKTRETRHCGKMDENNGKAGLSPLPKPPSAPVYLCPCPPPPKLHPGSCPCYDNTDDTELKPLTERCETKQKFPCPEVRVYYCPPTKSTCDKNKECDDLKKRPKP